MAEDPKTTAVAKRELPDAVVKRGIQEGQWNTLCRSLFPGANPNSVLLVWDYCKARGLDPMKKPCHIVPMEVKDAKTQRYEWRDVVMPGIYEYRTTAHRTHEYLGHTNPEYGPDEDCYGVTAPAWCAMTIFRWNPEAKIKAEFPVKVYFSEVVATKKNRDTGELRANARWTRAPKQMLTKCCEAAGIREAFPEEIGGEPTAEEMDGQRAIDGVVVESVAPAAPSPFDEVPEALRDRIEEAFQTLGLSDGQRRLRINEFLAAGGDLTAMAEKLLQWCKDEYRSRKAEAKAPDDQNQKKPNQKKPEAKPETTTPAAEDIFDAEVVGSGTKEELF